MADTEVKSRREARHSSEASHTNAPALLANDLIILGIEDGQGHGFYTAKSVPAFDGSDAAKNQYAIGVKYDYLRKAQSVAKKARKDSKDVQAELDAFTYTPESDAGDRILTVGTKRLEFAGEIIKEALVKSGKPHDDATVTKAVNSVLATDRGADLLAKSETRLRAWLATGYTPTKRGSKVEGATGADVDTAELSF